MPTINYVYGNDGSGDSEIYDGSGSGIDDDINNNTNNNNNNHRRTIFAIIIVSIILSPIILCVCIYIVISFLEICSSIGNNLNKIRIKFKRCIYRKPNLVFVNNEAFNNECSICLTHGNMKTLKCGHSYHKKCLIKWVKSCHQQNTIACCPTCRQPIEFKKAIELPKEEPNYISDSDSDSYYDYDY